MAELKLLFAELPWASIIAILISSAALLISILGYRRVNAMKALDLRIEIGRTHIDLLAAVQRLKEYHARALGSRTDVVKLLMAYSDDDLERYEREWEFDKDIINTILDQMPKIDEDYRNLDTSVLETDLVELHRLQGEVSKYLEKYEASIARDDATRSKAYGF